MSATVEFAALRRAIELLHMPSRVRSFRAEPLPDGVTTVLRIAAGEADLAREAAETLERPDDVVRKAAEFYIEQVLLAPDADNYRILGAKPSSPPGELRQNMALLSRCLHPDTGAQGTQAVSAQRVIRAWEALKTPAGRAAYDGVHRQMEPGEKYLQSHTAVRVRKRLLPDRGVGAAGGFPASYQIAAARPPRSGRLRLLFRRLLGPSKG